MGQGKHSNWKITRGESTRHKLTKPSTFRKFSKPEQFCILGIIFMVGFLAVSYGYYINEVYAAPYTVSAPRGNCATGYFNTTNGCQPDPYTTLWNGQVTGKFGRDFPVFSDAGFCHGSCTATLTVSQSQSMLLVTINDVSLCSSTITVADTFGLTWAQFTHKGTSSGGLCTTIYTADNAGNTGSDTVTVTDTAFSASNEGDITFYAFSATDSSQLTMPRLFQCNLAPCAVPNSGSYTYTLNNLPRWSIVLDLLTIQDNGGGFPNCLSAGTTSNGTSNTNAQNTCLSSTLNVHSLATDTGEIITNGPNTDAITITDTWSGGAGPLGGYQIGLLINGYPICPATYDCGSGTYAYYEQSSNLGTSIVLNPTTSHSAVAITTSAIDLSNCAAKACAFSTDTDQGGTFGPAASQQYAWFLTTNKTNPENTVNWNPLNDSSVVMAVYEFVTSGSTADYYVYIQRQVGQTLFQGSFDPGTTGCNFGGTLFSCIAVGIPNNHNSNVADPVLNFTGGANNVNVNAGQSYFCAGSINFGSHTCYIGGFASTAISFQAQVVNQTLFPWLSIQNSYYFGFWEGAVPNVGCSSGCAIREIVGIGAFAPIISVYTPPTVSVSPTQDTGGFFGWIGRSIGGAFNTVSNFISPAVNFLSSAGNSLLNVIVSGFAQSVSIMIVAFKLTLNFIGQQLGLGNIGDILVNTLLAIGALITNGFSAIVSFFSGLGTLITSGYFTFLAGGAVLIATLLPIALLAWNAIFNGAFTVNQLLFFDYVVGMIIVAQATKKGRGALKAFFAWVNLNVFLFTFLFNAAWVIFDIVTRPIHRTKETVDPVG